MNTSIERMKRLTKLKRLTKTLLLAVLLLGGNLQLFAQSETVTVGTGTSATWQSGDPFYDYYNYTTTASLYTDIEIGQSGCITAIAYNCATSNAFTGEVHVYMATVNKTEFSGDNDWPTSYTEVYSNTNATIVSSTGWYAITLSTPYYYDQSAGSLVVMVTKNASWKNQTWYYSSATNCNLYRGSDDSTNYASITNTSNGARGNDRPNIRFTFKKFYFSATATATAGGTASVTPTSTSVIGNSCDNATTTATFTATPNSGYRFLGWSETANGTIVSTDNPYAATITSTSTNSGSPTNTTLYARFQANVSPTAIAANQASVATYVGTPLAVGYTLTPANAYDHVAAVSSNTGVFTTEAWGSSGTVTVTPVAAGSATLTLTAYQIDNSTPITPSAIVTVNVRNRVATPTITFAPIGDGSTATATISCATSGNKIYYTINGSTPTTSDNLYSSGFTVNDNDIVMAIAVKDPADALWDDSDVVTETYTACSTADPVITYVQSGSTANVTIKAEEGATIYYTTDGSDPTTSTLTSGTTTVTINSVAGGTTVKAIAQNGSCQTSSVVSKEIITSSVSTTVVTLYDLEDHSWSYYSDAECPIRSLNPADVKITYFGNGIVMSDNSDYTASSTNYIVPGNTMYEGSAGVNVPNTERQHTFVYYKTLERGDATETAWTFSSGSQSSAASRCPYTPIYNPFQVRPTYGKRGTTDANNFTGWRGFQCWRLKSVSGGAIYSTASGGTALTTGAVIEAGNEIYFAPNSEYGMEVELEAVWARAYLIKGNQSGANTVLSRTEGVERNFMTLTANESYRFNGTSGRRITNVGYPVTISCYYPSGEAPDNTSGSVTGNNSNITLLANTKFENVTVNVSGNYINCDGYSLIIGRGCNSSRATNVYGKDSNATTALNYTIRIESGTYTNFYLTGTGRTYSSTVTAKCVLGCDYDRAAGANTNLYIAQSSGNIYGGKTLTFSGSGNRNNLTFDWVVKSGSFHDGLLGSSTGGSESIYLGSSQASSGNLQYIGKRRITVEGGEMAGIAGAMNNVSTNYAVNDGGWAVMIRMKGGTIRGSVYGAAAFAQAVGDRHFVCTGGTINGWVAGGCNGTQTGSGGTLTGDTKLYIGGNTHVEPTDSDPTIGTSRGGNVFGAGSGYSADYEIGEVHNSTVVLADNAVVSRGVYGGGNFGYVGSGYATNIYVLGGKAANVFGGSNQRFGQTVNILMKGGLITDGIYGGSNVSGTINNNVTMNINGGQVGTASQTANIHGGGYGANTGVSGNVELTLGELNQTEPGVTVYGDVYGGSALGTVNDATSDHTYVTLNAGTINGSLYGGALGDNSTAANVNGPVTVTVNGGSVRKTDSNGANGSGAVYGCNNINGAPQNAVAVVINGTDPAPSTGEYALYAVYGGGNQANYSYGTPTVTVNHCDNSIEYVYGGGNAAHITNGNTAVKIWGGNIGNVFGGGNGTVTAANVSGNTSVLIYGGNIGKVFGGSNSQGTIGGTINVEIGYDSNGEDCPMNIGEVYGGGNQAPSNVGNLTIGCMRDGDIIDYVYGGSNDADITGSVNLLIKGGRINNVFGGNNTGHTISGTITVTVDWAQGSCSSNYLGNVYGGGNLANYTAPSATPNYPQVLIKDAIVSGNVFGGGNGDDTGEKGWVEGNPQVIIGDLDAERHAIVRGNVYGGGNAAEVKGNTKVVFRGK